MPTPSTEVLQALLQEFGRESADPHWPAASTILSAYDPVAMPEAQRVLADMPGLSFAPDQSAALEGADALLAAAEWKEFRNPDFDAMQVAMRQALRQPVVFDGRNIYDPAVMALHGLAYFGIGRGVKVAGVAG